MERNHVPMCSLCREPITNFVCQDHLARNIARWLPDDVVQSFDRFHTRLSRMFFTADSVEQLPLGKQGCTCRTHDPVLCVHCYTREVNSWLTQRNPGLATQFRGIFSFGFAHDGSPRFRRNNSLRLDHDPPEHEFGLCDVCGEYGDELTQQNGQWVCQSCE